MTGLTTDAPNNVGSQEELNDDILALQTAAPGNYTIAFTKDISDHAIIPGGLGFGLFAVVLPANVTLTLDGQSHTLNGGGTGENASGAGRAERQGDDRKPDHRGHLGDRREWPGRGGRRGWARRWSVRRRWRHGQRA